MSEAQQAAFVISQSMCAILEGMAMLAHNQKVQVLDIGTHTLYGQEEFRALIDKYGLSSNAVLGVFQNAGR